MVTLRSLLALTVGTVRLHEVSDEAHNREHKECSITARKKDVRPKEISVGSKPTAAAAAAADAFCIIECEKRGQVRCLSLCAAHSVREMSKQKKATVNLQRKRKWKKREKK